MTHDVFRVPILGGVAMGSQVNLIFFGGVGWGGVGVEGSAVMRNRMHAQTCYRVTLWEVKFADLILTMSPIKRRLVFQNANLHVLCVFQTELQLVFHVH